LIRLTTYWAALPRWVRLLLAVFLSSGVAFPAPAVAQFLRVGPFDFTAVSTLEAVYTTNVERERESDATEEREDYYLILALDLVSAADVSPSTTLRLDTGVAVEKHFVRDDLDNSEAPFGRVRLESETELRYLTVYGAAGWEKTSQSATDVALPAGQSSKTRNPQQRTDYKVGAEWKGGPFSVGAEYMFERRRYEKEEFKSTDEDLTTVSWDAGWKMRENLSLKYDYERKRTERVNIPDDDPEWKETERITIDWDVRLIKRPELTYSLGVEKEDNDEGEGEWEPIHEVALRDTMELSSRLRLDWNALYAYEQNPEEDDIRLTYGATLSHDISWTMRQQVSATREPRETLGTTTETDTTTYRYALDKSDLFIPNLGALFRVSYQITKPPAGETEKILTYDFGLKHELAYSRRLIRIFSYDYFREDSNLNDEILDEHRVSWAYEYTF
jgi:hypothetical protein